MSCTLKSCYNFPLVREELPGVPASVRLVHQATMCWQIDDMSCPVNPIWGQAGLPEVYNQRHACLSTLLHAYIYVCVCVYIYIYMYIQLRCLLWGFWRKNDCVIMAPHYIYIYTHKCVVNFDALAQASDFRIERRQHVFFCWMQDLNPGSLKQNLQQTECPMTNWLSYQGSN